MSEEYLKNFQLCGDKDETFLEDVGRRYFMLFLKPIINGNGVGNSYVEAETRNRERTDLIIDHHGEQFIIEMKVWRGNAYNEYGEQQLSDYLDYYQLNKGYMLSFNFNKCHQTEGLMTCASPSELPLYKCHQNGGVVSYVSITDFPFTK